MFVSFECMNDFSARGRLTRIERECCAPGKMLSMKEIGYSHKHTHNHSVTHSLTLSHNPKYLLQKRKIHKWCNTISPTAFFRSRFFLSSFRPKCWVGSEGFIYCFLEVLDYYTFCQEPSLVFIYVYCFFSVAFYFFFFFGDRKNIVVWKLSA